MEQKGLKGGTKSYGYATGGGGVRTPPPPLATDMLLFRNVLWGEPQTPPPPPGGVPRVSIGPPPPPRISAPLWRPFSPGDKNRQAKKKRERGALDSAAFKLAPIQAGRAPPPRLATHASPLHPPPLGTPLPPPMAGHRHTFLS